MSDDMCACEHPRSVHVGTVGRCMDNAGMCDCDSFASRAGILEELELARAHNGLQVALERLAGTRAALAAAEQRAEAQDTLIDTAHRRCVELLAERDAALAQRDELAAALREWLAVYEHDRERHLPGSIECPRCESGEEELQKVDRTRVLLERTPAQAGARRQAMVAVVEAAREWATAEARSREEMRALPKLMNALAALDQLDRDGNS